jgi:hypothetical protein
VTSENIVLKFMLVTSDRGILNNIFESFLLPAPKSEPMVKATSFKDLLIRPHN